MGWQATGWAFSAPIENAGCKFVLVALAERAGNESSKIRTWYCHPSIETIGEYTAQGYRTIQRHLDWLEANGYLTRQQRMQSKGRKGCYDFTLNPHQLADGQSGRWPDEPPEGVEIGQTEPVIGTSQAIAKQDARPRIWPKSAFCPADWHPIESHALKAVDLGVTPEQVQIEVQKFREFEFKDPKTNWDLAFHRWLRTAAERLKENRHAGGMPASSYSTGADRGAERSAARVEAMVAGARQAVTSGRRRWGL